MSVRSRYVRCRQSLASSRAKQRKQPKQRKQRLPGYSPRLLKKTSLPLAREEERHPPCKTRCCITRSFSCSSKQVEQLGKAKPAAAHYQCKQCAGASAGASAATGTATKLTNSAKAWTRAHSTESGACGELFLLQRTQPCLLYTSPSPRDYAASRMPSSA